jgi:hypothetical protein
MKTLSIHLIALALLCGATTTLHAQAATPAAPAAEPAAQPAAAQPEQAPAAASPVPAASPAPAATEPAPAATPETTPIPDPLAPTEEERQRREADRSRIRLLLARARAERAALDQQQAPQSAREPAPQPEPVRHGDAGAAIAFGLSLELPWHTEQAFDLFSANDVGQRYGLWATYDLLALGESTFLAAGAGFDVEQMEVDNLFAGSLDTELSAVVLYGTAVVRYVPVDWLQPHARLSLGGQFVRSRLAFGDNTYQNDGDLPFGSLGAGFTLRTPTRLFESRRGEMASLSFGIMVEGGYALVSALEMKVDGRGPDDRDIALIESDIEDLDRSGPFMRMSLVARFY